MATTYDIAIIEQPDGVWDVVQDRRVLIGYLTEDEARDWVERRRKPDERVHRFDKAGNEREITRELRRPSRRQSSRV